MSSRPRRIITRVLVFIALGAIVNVSVAWRIAFYVKYTKPATVYSYDHIWGTAGGAEDDPLLMVMREAGSECFLLARFPNRIPTRLGVNVIPLSDEELRWSPSHGRWDLSPSVFEDSRGWPMRSLRWAFIYEPSEQGIVERVRYAIPLDDQPQKVRVEGASSVGQAYFYWPCNAPQRALPCYPIWSGFVLSAVFYALILGLLYVTCASMRRFMVNQWRVKQGRCPACGYQIAPGVSEKCSECGAALPQRLRTQTT